MKKVKTIERYISYLWFYDPLNLPDIPALLLLILDREMVYFVWKGINNL